MCIIRDREVFPIVYTNTHICMCVCILLVGTVFPIFLHAAFSPHFLIRRLSCCVFALRYYFTFVPHGIRALLPNNYLNQFSLKLFLLQSLSYFMVVFVCVFVCCLNCWLDMKYYIFFGVFSKSAMAAAIVVTFFLLLLYP